jgi:AraC family transcriptional activator of mtrCDE
MRGVHYNLSGSGAFVVDNMPPIELRPHTLVIMPPNRSFRLEAANDQGQFTNLIDVDYAPQFKPGSAMQRFVAGDAHSPHRSNL